MAGFFYYLPGCQTVDRVALEDFGLTHVVDSLAGELAIHARTVHNNHPAGPGSIVGAADRFAVEEIKQSDAIQWKAFPRKHAAKQAWLGWLPDQLPKPEDLRRTAGTIEGESILLADGEYWEIPIARDVEGTCRLPRAFDLDDDTGEWVGTGVRREYAKLWGHAMGYYTAMVEALAKNEQSFFIPDGQALVADTLAINYRVSMRELATLGVLVTGIVQDVAEIIMDQHDSVKKKSDADAGSESSG